MRRSHKGRTQAGLREASLQDCLLDLVEPIMLSVAFSNLVKVDLSNANLGEHQVGALFSLTDEQTRVMWDAIMEKDCKFKSFEMTGVNLGNVGIEVLSDDPISSLVAVASLEPPARPNSSCASPPLPASPSCKDPAFTGWNKQ